MGVERFSRGLVLTAAVALLVGSPAAAEKPASVSAGKQVDVTGPRLAAGYVFWAQRRTDRDLDVRAATLPGLRMTRTLFSIRGKGGDTGASGFLAGTPALAAVRGAQIEQGRYGLPGSVFDLGTTAFFGGRVAQVSPPQCDGFRSCGPPEIDADGTRVLLSGPTGDYRLIDVATGEVKDTPVRAQSPQVAGSYLAWIENRQAVVFDHASGREVYRVAGLATTTSLDLQADGKTAFLVRVPGGYSLAWASISEPWAHRLALKPIDGSYIPVVKNDQIAFQREKTEELSDLGVIGLTGPGRILVRSASPSEAYGSRRTFDFDGRRLAWSTRDCSGQRMASAEVSDLRERPVRLRLIRCPLAGLRLRATATELAIAFDCLGLRRSCSADKLSVRTARAYRIGGRGYARGTKLTRVRSDVVGGRDPVNLPRLELTRAGKRLVRARARIRSRVVGDVGDGPGFGSYTQRRTGLTTIRRYR